MADLDANALIGQLVDGRYRVESVLGHGGMGVVFKATQTSMQRPVAMKTLHPQFATSPAFFERFRREAEIASRLHHPNIITIFDFGKTPEGLCYYVMEHLEGESLRQRVKRDGPLTLRQAAAIIEQVALGVGHAHKHGVIHRDLKPHNVMLSVVDGNEYVKVLDFGLVKAMEQDDDEEQLTSTGQVLGTPQYMPPEQAGGEKVDQRSDLYSLTGVFYSTLTGHSPFGANTVRKALQASLTQKPIPIAEKRLAAPVPSAIEAFCHKGLAADPAERFQTAEAFIQGLNDALADATQAQLDAVPQRSADGNKDTGSGSSGASRKSRGLKAVSAVNQAAVKRATLPSGAPTPSLPPPERSSRVPVVLGALVGLALIGGAIGAVMKKPAPAPVPTPAAVVEPTPAVVPQVAPATTPLHITLQTTPPGAEVLDDGALLGTTPITIDWPRGEKRVLLFRAAGFRDLEKSLKPEADQTLDFVLEAVRKALPGRPVKPNPPRPPDDISTFE